MKRRVQARRRIAWLGALLAAPMLLATGLHGMESACTDSLAVAAAQACCCCDGGATGSCCCDAAPGDNHAVGTLGTAGCACYHAGPGETPADTERALESAARSGIPLVAARTCTGILAGVSGAPNMGTRYRRGHRASRDPLYRLDCVYRL
jgi:hypothetical protein